MIGKGETRMCLIIFQKGHHPDYKLIMAANRDEFYGRPTEKAHFWDDHPYILAGRDLRGMGTWLGITKQGRVAALTNIREPEEDATDKKTRGDLVKDFLTGDMAPDIYLENLKKDIDQYAGFNLLVGAPDNMYYMNNRQAVVEKVAQGIHGLSNHFLNTPWPKVVNGKDMFREGVEDEKQVHPGRLFDILAHSEEVEEDLPDTGVGFDLEKKLSPLFIRTDHYGTRSSTVLLIDKQNQVTFAERTHEQGKMIHEETFTFEIK